MRAVLRVAMLLVAVACCGLPAGVGAERPNFVFFLVDDLGYMDVGANNPDTFYETPRIDRLAHAGMRFTNGYAACPVCSPTRYSIMTGKYPARVGATNYFSGRRAARFLPAPLHDRMPLEEVTFAQVLRRAGYRTAFVGKWHLGPTPEFWPENRGFDINVGGCAVGMPPSGYFAPYENPRLKDGARGEHLTERLTDEALAFLEESRQGPFFLYFCFYTVHTPIEAPAELVKKYESKRERSGRLNEEQFAPEEQVWPTDEPRHVRIVQNHATYAAMVETLDQSVGRVLDKLDEIGLTDNTVVMLTSDNGGLSTAEGAPTCNLPLRGGKGWLYEGGIREPFFISWPGVTRAASTCDVPVMSTDFYPTILEMAGLPSQPEQHLDGVSLVPLLTDAAPLPERDLFWHYPHYGNQGGFPGGVIRRGEWKLLERYEDGQVHLYNLREDIQEQTDLVSRFPERVATLRARLHEWYDEVGAKFLRPREGGPQPWRP